MKAHFTKDRFLKDNYVDMKIAMIPTTYEALKKEYISLLKIQEDYKKNMAMQASDLAQQYVDEDAVGAFKRVCNMWILAIKRDKSLTAKTAQRLLERVSTEICPEWEHYCKKPAKKLDEIDGGDGAGDLWIQSQLEGYPCLYPETEM